MTNDVPRQLRVEPIVSQPLKPCPFCGSPAVVINYGYEPRVECTECNGQTRIITSLEHAVAAWNMRAATPASKVVRYLMESGPALNMSDHEVLVRLCRQAKTLPCFCGYHLSDAMKVSG